LTIVPWVLVFYGPNIRARSKFAREIMWSDGLIPSIVEKQHLYFVFVHFGQSKWGAFSEYSVWEASTEVMMKESIDTWYPGTYLPRISPRISINKEVDASRSRCNRVTKRTTTYGKISQLTKLLDRIQSWIIAAK
jgi:hypothetical protein